MRRNELMEILMYVAFAALDILAAWGLAIGGFSKELSIAAGFYVAVRMFGRDLEVAWNKINGKETKSGATADGSGRKLISRTEKEAE